MSNEQITCGTPSCGRPIYAKGFCRQCYNRTRHTSSRYYRKHTEYRSVVLHWYATFRATNRKAACYKGMPFFPAWNPEKGGSFAVAEKWILQNLGRRPSSTHHLHIVDRVLGFVPGNLQWVPREKHKQEELIARLLRENQHLRERLQRYE